MSELGQKILEMQPLNAVIKEHQLFPRRSLGQNFIFDINLTRRIARSAKPLDSGTVIEIGAGPGGLTRALLIEGASQVIAIEKDKRAIQILRELEEIAKPRLKVICADALELSLIELGKEPIQVVANLPFNIATNLIFKWLESTPPLSAITIMIQKEVANRLCAQPGNSAYGRLTLMVNLLAETEFLFDVPANAFVPRPKVISSMVQVLPRKKPLFKTNKSALQKVLVTAFNQRRKMLRSSFKIFGGSKLLEKAGINPEERPENLTLEAFCTLANLIETNRF
ncbi:16S rRNA (adenine(1518)-N(6)/adenine(1519)-N(6))-dimethyltransferase RsmA [Rhodospirillaceae bacterium]|nr:16S rRNA (adenine(1518)-N(6)/adenine(1519)-N(6))-dimethyltransferase RsmA [Rhodospirillaceae bacterium]